MTTIINEVIPMLKGHWFWGTMTLACLIWYSTITIYVAIKGIGDIRNMLRKLSISKKINNLELLIDVQSMQVSKIKYQNDSFAVILSEAKNLSFVGQILRLRLRMTLKCHFAF